MIGYLGSPGGFTVLADAPAPVATAQPSLLEQLAPIAGQFVATATSNPYQRAELARAELATAIQRGAPAAVIARARAKLIAAEQQLALQHEATRSKQEWATIGKVAAISGIGLILVITFSVLARRRAR